jgi:hypothetical protein
VDAHSRAASRPAVVMDLGSKERAPERRRLGGR